MRKFRLPLALAAVAAAMPIVLTAAPAPPQQEALVIARFVDKAADYVRRFQDELTSIIAEEQYSQTVRAQTPRAAGTPLETTMSSEVFFMFTPGHDWMTIRDVVAVNGQPLETRPDLRTALRDLPAPQVAARFKAYNSRFNVGRVHRNFNEPTLSLLVLDDRHRTRFTFARAKAKRGDDPTLVRLTFRESRRPTLIRDLDGKPVFSSGDLTLDPATGRVDDIRFLLTVGKLKIALETDYAVDPHLGIPVPVRFTEHYQDGRASRDGRGGDRHEEIVCEATYSNFQRFAVQTKIK